MKNRFLIGFEFEFLSPFSHSTTKRHVGSKIVKDDCSVYDNRPKYFKWVSTEVVTRPQTERQAIKDLKEVLSYIEDRGLLTNNTTGIHVNISTNKPEKLNLETLIATTDDYYIASVFNRRNNIYCRPWSKLVRVLNQEVDTFNTRNNNYYKTSLRNEFSNLVYSLYKDPYSENSSSLFPWFQARKKILKNDSTKYMSVNISKLNNGYIEYRMIGGPKYESKLESIMEAIDHFKESQLLAIKKPNEELIQRYLNWASK